MTRSPDAITAGSPVRGRFAPTLVRVLVGAVLATLVAVVLSWETTTVVQRVEQPSPVSYADGSPHYLALKRYDSLGGALVGGARDELWLGRDPGLGYGHTVALDITGVDVERFEARWTDAGVEVRFASGHVVEVPAESFTGGR